MKSSWTRYAGYAPYTTVVRIVNMVQKFESDRLHWRSKIIRKGISKVNLIGIRRKNVDCIELSNDMFYYKVKSSEFSLKVARFLDQLCDCLKKDKTRN
jgi:hypothetical protein